MKVSNDKYCIMNMNVKGCPFEKKCCCQKDNQ